MIKKLISKIKETNIDFYLISFLSIYVFLIAIFYYKPPWFIDHLTYVLTALPKNISDLNFWNNLSPNLPEGTINERWAILLPIILFHNFLFFLPPHLSSQVFIFSVWISILILSYLFVKKHYSALNAKIFLIIFVLGIHHTKNRATEILADPVGILLVILLFFLNSFFDTKRKYYFLGSVLFLIPLTKIHYGIFVLFFIFYQRKKIFKFIPELLIGSLLTIIFCEIVFFISYEIETFLQLNKNTFNVISYYFIETSTRWKSMSDGEYWSTLWIKLILNSKFLPPIFLMLFLKYFYDENKQLIFENLSITFLLLILFFAYFLNFPSNSSYAYPIWIFSIIFFSNFIIEIKPKKISNNLYIYFVITSFILMYPAMYYYQFYMDRSPKHNIYLSEFLFILTLTYLPFVFFKTKEFFRLILIWPMIFLSFFSHNFYNIQDHSWWRSGYNNAYEYLNSTLNLIENDNSNYLVIYSTWPMYGKPSRESTYAKLGLQNMTRMNITIDFNYDIQDEVLVKNFLITDFEITKEIQDKSNLLLEKETSFYSNKYEKYINLHLYKKKN